MALPPRLLAASVLLLLAPLLRAESPPPAAAPDGAIAAAQALIRRVWPGRADAFVCERIPAEGGRDVFEYESGPGGKIVLRGNGAESLAVAFNQYLRREVQVDFDWLAAGPLAAAGPLPRPAAKVRQPCLARERFFLNYCTYGYTMPWWGWDRWQRFLDWMAMNGVNRPLLQTGQEAVWLKVWRSYGMTTSQVCHFFSGPAHLPWNRMANLDKWGGPLPLSYIEGQRRLQERIVARARELGMHPILSAFAGHVPAELRALRPGARITQLKPGWGGLPAEYATFYLSPDNPLFGEIQGRFLREQAALYGTDHLYAADPFNELTPPSWDPAYLASVSRAIMDGMEKADPAARWYQMTWTFTWDKRWTPEGLSAMLRAVPGGRMVLLDYVDEEQEFYRQTDNCFGLPFIWDYLGNFGGNTHLTAPLLKTATREARALAVPNNVGIGSTLEGFNATPVIFDLVLEQPWHAGGATDLSAWIRAYADQRAGRPDRAVEDAWLALATKVLVDDATPIGGHGVIFQADPDFGGRSGREKYLRISYRREDLVAALERMLQASPRSRLADGYRFNVVNLTRQALGNLGMGSYRKMRAAFEAKDAGEFKRQAAGFLALGRDLDRLLGTRREFLLGSWLRDARGWGVSPAEKDYYEENAREIITSWHLPGGDLTDYASRQWNGLVRDYYLPRWEKWIELAARSLDEGAPFPRDEYVAWRDLACARWERAPGGGYLTEPQGDPVATAGELLDKYRDALSAFPGEN